MFGISLAELSIVILVFFIFMGPEEMPMVVSWLKKTRKYINELKKQYNNILEDTLSDESINELKDLKNDLNRQLDEITDLEGNVQERYNIDDLISQDEIRKSNLAKQKEQVDE